MIEAVHRVNLALNEDGLKHWLSVIVPKLAKMLPDDPDRVPNYELRITCEPIESGTEPPNAGTNEKLPGLSMEKAPIAGPLRTLHEHMSVVGWQLTKRGWPEFFGYHPESQSVACIKVEKHKGRRLQSHQRLVLRALAAYNVPCYLFDPDERLFVHLHLDSPQIREGKRNGEEDKNG